MTAAPNLTTLARVKAWLGIQTDIATSDDQLRFLIKAVSRFIYQYIDLPTVVVSQYSERRDGYGKTWIAPYIWPLLSVGSIQYGGSSITVQSTGNPLQAGYTLNNPQYGPTRITLHGWCLPYGKDQVLLNYTAGFQQVEDTIIIPVSNTDDPPVVIGGTVVLSQLWAADGGVTYADGTPFTKVLLTPAIGEYTVIDGVYGFNLGDNGEEIIVTYSYVPADLEQAVIELIGTTFRDKDHIGVKSKTLGGQETVAYFQNQISPSMAMMLGPYRRVTPRS